MKKIKVDKRIQEFLSTLSESKGRSAMLLREIVLSADKDVKETIKTIRWTTKRSGNSLTLTFEKDNGIAEEIGHTLKGNER